MYDHVRIDESHALPGFDGNPAEVNWQTKTFDRPALEVYRITEDGRLLKERAHYESVPEEDRPGYDDDLGGFENEFEKMWGMLTKVSEGWENTEFHGIIEFHSIIDDEYRSFNAKFTDGRLVEFSENDR